MSFRDELIGLHGLPPPDQAEQAHCCQAKQADDFAGLGDFCNDEVHVAKTDYAQELPVIVSTPAGR